MEVESIYEMLMDALGPMPSNSVEENVDEEPNEEAKRKFETLEAAKKPLICIRV